MSKNIHITQPDYLSLKSLISSGKYTSGLDAKYLGVLEAELRKAIVVQETEIPADIITMNSIVSVKNMETGNQSTYKLVFPEKADIQFVRGLSAKLRAEVLDRNGFTCQMCGLTPGDIDPATGRKVRLHIGHIKDKSLGGKDELSNLRALCSTCNQGAKNITTERPSEIWLLAQIRRANLDDQRAVYQWLNKKFHS